MADLNDCLLESNDIVVSKTKTGIVLLKLKKEQVCDNQQQQLTMTLKKDDKNGVVFKECGKIYFKIQTYGLLLMIMREIEKKLDGVRVILQRVDFTKHTKKICYFAKI